MAAPKKKFETNYTQKAHFTHTPVTDIVDRIREIAKTKGMIRKIRITPQMAEDIMTINSNNRPVKHATVVGYAKDMTEGNWRYTPQSRLAVDTKLQLIDGQHQLLAIIASAKAQEMDIMTGYDPETFMVLDKGRLRTSGDVFALEGISDSNKAASAANFIVTMQLFNKVMAGGRNKEISDSQLIEWVRDERNRKRLAECVLLADDLFKLGNWLLPTIYAGMLFLLGNARKQKAEDFMRSLASGELLSPTQNSPVYYLRRKLEQWKKNSQAFGKAKQNEMKVRYIITAWNHYLDVDGRERPLQIKELKLHRDDKDIPKIRRN